MSHYLHTAYGTCPWCEERNPGHVYDSGAQRDADAWVCPECGHSHTPDRVDAEPIPEEGDR